MANIPNMRPKHNLMLKYLERIMEPAELENLIDRYVEEKIKESATRKSNLCPRCGKPTMAPQKQHNALSRQSMFGKPTYVCGICGIDEAVNAKFERQPDKWVYPTNNIFES